MDIGPAARVFFFFFNDTATTEIYTLSLHDALPISPCRRPCPFPPTATFPTPMKLCPQVSRKTAGCKCRSEEHTSELQSRLHLVCRLLLEKKKHHTSINLPLLRQPNILIPVIALLLI